MIKQKWNYGRYDTRYTSQKRELSVGRLVADS